MVSCTCPNPREVDQIAWVSFDQARRQLGYRSDRGLLRLVEELQAEEDAG